jgi:putative peptide zinc metalloprotease protein
MERPTHSQTWERIGHLRPRLRSGVRIYRRRFRDRRGYVVHDPVNNQFFRLDPVSYHLLGLLDGQRSVEEAWVHTTELHGDAAPTQNEVVGLLSQLYYMNLVAFQDNVDPERLFERMQVRQRSQVKRQAASFLFIKIPLFDPAAILDWLLPLIRPLLGMVGLVLWVALVGVAVLHLPTRWEPFLYSATNLLAADNLIYLGLVFIVVKAVHEFGHGLACRFFGGEVHEMGVMFLVLHPVPYCDATASWALPHRYQRVMVGLAGIIVELAIAAVAMLVWSHTAPGTLHQVAYNTIFISGVSSVLFNANPLLRFDGYYVLSDLLDIPNLYQRANAQVKYLFQRYAFGLTQTRPAVARRTEAFWLVVYFCSSWFYRVFVFAGIIWWVSHQLFGLGVFMGILVLINWVIRPVLKLLHWLVTSATLTGTRWRAMASCAAVLAAAVLVLGVWKVDEHARAYAVIQSPMQADVINAVEGFVREVYVHDGQRVRQGDPILRLENPSLEAERQRLAAQQVELEIALSDATVRSAALARVINARIEALRKHIVQVEERIARQTLGSPMDGVLVAPVLEGAQGRYLPRGEVIGQVRSAEGLAAIAVLEQEHSAWIFDPSQPVRPHVELRTLGRPAQVIAAKVERVNPAARRDLPHEALGNLAGGHFRVERREREGLIASESLYEVRLILQPPTDQVIHAGQRAVVRFTLSPRPLLQQGWRRLMQVSPLVSDAWQRFGRF